MSTVEQAFRCPVNDGDGRTQQMQITLTYDPANPFSLVMVFHDPSADVPWVFARDLLAEGLTRPAGHGDVVVMPSDNTLMIAVKSDEGSATVLLPRYGVQAFLDRTYEAVPAGAETIDIAAALTDFFGATP